MRTLQQRTVGRCLLILCLAAGCGLSAGGGSSMMGRSWSSGSADPVPGITQGEVKVVRLYGFDQSEQTAVFWVDDTDVLSGSSSSSGTAGSRYEASVKTPTGGVKLRMVLAEGETGAVTIGDQTYPLSAGHVFLFRTKGDELQVAQVDLDVDWEATADYQSLAASTPAIGDFFAGSAEAEPTVDDVTDTAADEAANGANTASEAEGGTPPPE